MGMFCLQWDRKRNELIADGEHEIRKSVLTDVAVQMWPSNRPRPFTDINYISISQANEIM